MSTGSLLVRRWRSGDFRVDDWLRLLLGEVLGSLWIEPSDADLFNIPGGSASIPGGSDLSFWSPSQLRLPLEELLRSSSSTSWVDGFFSFLSFLFFSFLPLSSELGAFKPSSRSTKEGFLGILLLFGVSTGGGGGVVAGDGDDDFDPSEALP